MASAMTEGAKGLRRTSCGAVVGAGLARPVATLALPWGIREGQAPPLPTATPEIRQSPQGLHSSFFILHYSFSLMFQSGINCSPTASSSCTYP